MAEPAASVLLAWRHPKARGAAGRCIGQTDLAVDPRKAKRLAHRIRTLARRERLPRVVTVSALRRARDVGRWLARWGWRVQVDARVGIGQITALQSTVEGYRQTLRTDSGTGTQFIKLTLRVGIGQIEVVRASAAGFAPTKTSAPGADEGLTSLRGDPVRSFEDGTVVFADGAVQFSDGQIIEANRATLIPISRQAEDGSLELANGAIIQADGTVITPGGFVIPRP